MFLIFGISQKECEINYTKKVKCPICSKEQIPKIWMKYSYFMLFFIPIIKWNKKYFITLPCCNKFTELDNVAGKKVEKNEEIDISHLNFEKCDSKKYCIKCGFQTNENYEFCPHCGEKLL